MTFVANYDVCCQLWRLFLRGFITVLYPVSLYFIYNYRLPVREVPVEKTSSSEAPNQVKLEISANPARNPTGKKVFCCSSCNKSFQKSGNLKRHLRNTTIAPFAINHFVYQFSSIIIFIHTKEINLTVVLFVPKSSPRQII